MPAFKAVGTFVGSASTASPGIPAGTVANDILLLFVESENESISLSTAEGFAEVPTQAGQGTAGATTASRIAVFWKRATGTDAAPTVADAGDHVATRILSFEGCITTGNPWNGTPVWTHDAVADTTVDAAGPTTTVDNSLVVIGAANVIDTVTAQTVTYTNANLTGLTGTGAGDNTNQGTGGGFNVGTGTKATAGAVGNTTVDFNNATQKSIVVLALTPADAVAADVPLETAAAAAAPTLALTAAPQVLLAAAGSVLDATLALAASAQLQLEQATAGSTATLDLTAPSAGPLSTGTGIVELGSLSAPEAGTQTLSIRARAASGSGVLRTTVYDSDGVTARGTEDFTLTGAFQTFTLTPSGITDWSALQVGFEGRTDTTLTAEVSWVELRVPQAAAGGPANVVLQASPAVSTATLALTAQTRVALTASAAQSSSSLALTAPAEVSVDAAAAQSSATLALAATTQVPLGTAPAQSAATLALTAPTRVPLAAAAALTSASLALKAQTQIPLNAAAAQSTATLAITAGVGVIPISAATATSTATLALKAQTSVPLQATAATATASLTVSTPTQTFIALDPAAGAATSVLAVTAPTTVTLHTAAGTVTATLTVYAPTAALLTLGPAAAIATGTLVLAQLGTRWPPHTNPRWGMNTETRWPPDPNPQWPVTAGTRWPMTPEMNW